MLHALHQGVRESVKTVCTKHCVLSTASLGLQKQTCNTMMKRLCGALKTFPKKFFFSLICITFTSCITEVMCAKRLSSVSFPTSTAQSQSKLALRKGSERKDDRLFLWRSLSVCLFTVTTDCTVPVGNHRVCPDIIVRKNKKLRQNLFQPQQNVLVQCLHRLLL